MGAEIKQLGTHTGKWGRDNTTEKHTVVAEITQVGNTKAGGNRDNTDGKHTVGAKITRETHRQVGAEITQPQNTQWE